MQGFSLAAGRDVERAAAVRYVRRLVDGRSSQQNLTPAIGLVMHFQASAAVIPLHSHHHTLCCDACCAAERDSLWVIQVTGMIGSACQCGCSNRGRDLPAVMLTVLLRCMSQVLVRNRGRCSSLWVLRSVRHAGSPCTCPMSWVVRLRGCEGNCVSIRGYSDADCRR